MSHYTDQYTLQYATIDCRHIKNGQVLDRMTNKGSHIIACIDGSIQTDNICDYAAWAAKSTDLSISLLNISQHQQIPNVEDLGVAVGLGTSTHLYNELSDTERDRFDNHTNRMRSLLERSKMRIMSEHHSQVEAIQISGNLKETLVNLENRIECLVVGIRGHGHDGSDEGIGNHLAPIIRSLHRPVLVVNKPFSAPHKIMIAYDGSPSANKAIEFICASSLFKNKECHLVTVDSDDAVCSLDSAVSQLENAGLKPTTAHLTGPVCEQLIDYQKNFKMDLVMMGAYSHLRLRDLFFGSLTTKMLGFCEVPLLLIR